MHVVQCTRAPAFRGSNCMAVIFYATENTKKVKHFERQNRTFSTGPTIFNKFTPMYSCDRFLYSVAYVHFGSWEPTNIGVHKGPQNLATPLFILLKKFLFQTWISYQMQNSLILFCTTSTRTWISVLNLVWNMVCLKLIPAMFYEHLSGTTTCVFMHVVMVVVLCC